MLLTLTQALLFLSLQPVGFEAPGAEDRGVRRCRFSQCWSEALSVLQWRASQIQLVW